MKTAKKKSKKDVVDKKSLFENGAPVTKAKTFPVVIPTPVAPVAKVNLKAWMRTQYGYMGPVNYDGSNGRTLTEDDMLFYKPLSNPKSSKDILTTQVQRMVSAGNSIWRLMAPSLVYSAGTVASYPNGHRKLFGIYFDDLLPGYVDNPSIWRKHSKKLMIANKAQFGKLGELIRHCGVKTAMVIREGDMLDFELIDMLSRAWVYMGFPTENYRMNFRLCVFTSSFKGGSWEEKLKKFHAIPGSRKLHTKLIVIADDLSVADTIRLAKELDARASYDLMKVLDGKGKRITPNSESYKAIKKHTWTDSKGSSGFPPMVFASGVSSKKENRVIEAFKDSQSPVVFY